MADPAFLSVSVRRPITLALGKLLVYVAWADGVVKEEEVEVVKDLVYTLPDITQEEWASVEIYFEYPITERERDRILEDFIALLQSDKEKAFAIASLEKILTADGQIREAEKLIVREFADAINAKGTGLFARIIELLSRLLNTARARREKATAVTYTRERELDDFINNPVFFRLSRTLKVREINTGFNKDQLRKLCLAGSIMARVSQADDEIHEDEVSVIFEALCDNWKLEEDAALIVTEIALNKEYGSLDMLRLCRQFFEITEEEERLKFMETLGDIVHADASLMKAEIDEIEGIATHMKFTRKQVRELLRVQDEDLSE